MAEIDTNGIVALHADGISAGVNPLGAELHYLRDAAGRDLLWDGDPAFWTGRAPILFPIIGALANGRYNLGDADKSYTLDKHGFARRSIFTVVEQTADTVLFRLAASEATRAVYPFEFRLDIRFTLAAGSLAIEATVANQGDGAMPASFGFHPALRWPLPYGEPRAAHRILFAEPESEPIRRIDGDGLVKPAALPSPIVGDTLLLKDDLFVDDAIILDPVTSHSVRYGAPVGPQLRVDFPAMPQLGIWTKPGAGYICIEPWHGIADPKNASGNMWEKPGIAVVEPGAARAFAISITIEA